MSRLKMIMYTLLSCAWRIATYVNDWRAMFRKIIAKPLVDVIFIPNLRDEDKKFYLGNWRPKDGHADGLHMWHNGISSRTRALNTTTSELATSSGRQKAREQFISACRWARERRVKVVLLAAGTKHLFNSGQKLREMFPELLFTIGDNGTAWLLVQETLRAFKEAGLIAGNCRIAILGPYGILGNMMTQALSQKGFNIIGAGPNKSALDRIANEFGIEVCQRFDEIGKVDAVVACTHSDKIRLNSQNVDILRRPGRKLLLIDVAEPSNLSYREHQKCRERVVRQDAGNAYSKGLKYVLGAISYRMFGLTRGVTFGCFAEAISLASAMRRGEDVRNENWFDVNQANIIKVEEMFDKEKFGLPSPRCFGRPLESFDLNISSVSEKSSIIGWKLAYQKIMSLLF